jgi:hypothetical protein
MVGFVLRILLTLASLPGVIVHELGHQILCHLTGTRVLKVCYFRFGIPAGYVLHERPRSWWRHLFIALGPFLVNTLAAFGLAWLALKGCLPGASIWTAKVLPLWLAVAIAMHAFPSYGDAESFLDAVWSKGAGLLAKLLGTPVALVMFLGAFLGNRGLDLLFGLGVGLVAPWYLLRGLHFGAIPKP